MCLYRNYKNPSKKHVQTAKKVTSKNLLFGLSCFTLFVGLMYGLLCTCYLQLHSRCSLEHIASRMADILVQLSLIVGGSHDLTLLFGKYQGQSELPYIFSSVCLWQSSSVISRGVDKIPMLSGVQDEEAVSANFSHTNYEKLLYIARSKRTTVKVITIQIIFVSKPPLHGLWSSISQV